MFFFIIVLLYFRVCLSKCIFRLYVIINISYFSDVIKVWNFYIKGISFYCIEIFNIYFGYVYVYSKVNYSLIRN